MLTAIRLLISLIACSTVIAKTEHTCHDLHHLPQNYLEELGDKIRSRLDLEEHLQVKKSKANGFVRNIIRCEKCLNISRRFYVNMADKISSILNDSSLKYHEKMKLQQNIRYHVHHCDEHNKLSDHSRFIKK